VSFAAMMIPHHVQAIAMAAALRQATDPKVIALAPKIKAAQTPEIQRMSGWLAGWANLFPPRRVGLTWPACPACPT